MRIRRIIRKSRGKIGECIENREVDFLGKKASGKNVQDYERMKLREKRKRKTRRGGWTDSGLWGQMKRKDEKFGRSTLRQFCRCFPFR